MTKIRTYPDGSIGFSATDPDLAAHLDRTYIRCAGGEQRWWPKPRAEAVDVPALREQYAGRRAIVLGKGPSLECLREIPIADSDIILAINEAALLPGAPRVTMGVAVDQHVVDAVAGRLRSETLFLAPAETAKGAGISTAVGVWDATLRPNMGASPAAVRILHLIGASELVLIGFDGYDSPTPGKVYATSVLRLGVADRDSGDFRAVNPALADELAKWPAGSVTFWHRLPKPRVKKGG